MERAAAEQPLVVVFDDIQWGEDTLLDLIEHVALLSSGASILLLCISRPEIGERRRSWPVTMRLEPLRDEAVEQLIGERIPDELRERIAHAAGGNPLFIEEMVAMAGDGNGEVVVPPRCRRCLRRAWISSMPASGASSSVERSKARSSTAVLCKRSPPTDPR